MTDVLGTHFLVSTFSWSQRSLTIPHRLGFGVFYFILSVDTPHDLPMFLIECRGGNSYHDMTSLHAVQDGSFILTPHRSRPR